MSNLYRAICFFPPNSPAAERSHGVSEDVRTYETTGSSSEATGEDQAHYTQKGVNKNQSMHVCITHVCLLGLLLSVIVIHREV